MHRRGFSLSREAKALKGDLRRMGWNINSVCCPVLSSALAKERVIFCHSKIYSEPTNISISDGSGQGQRSEILAILF